MEKSKKTQVLTLSLIATLISITPLLSSSFRSTYLYFIINVLIVVLGVEAGFLSSISSSSSSSSSSLNKNLEDDMIKNTKGGTNARTKSRVFEEEKNDMKMEEKTLVENSSVLNKKVIACVDEVKKMIKKCPSTPSMFFIGGHESDAEVEEYVQEEEEEEEEEEEKVYEDDKLFVKAETFIVNFYKQLKMQREDSWKNIHGFNENNLIS